MALLRAKFYTMKSSERKNIATLPNPLQLIEDVSYSAITIYGCDV